MNNRTRAALKTPVIGRVVTLNKYMITHGKRAYKIVQHNYIDTILKEGALLFKHCYRHLQGLDYRRCCVLRKSYKNAEDLYPQQDSRLLH